MPTYLKVDAETGEMHPTECGVCGVLSISGASEDEIQIFRDANNSDGHILVEITNEEKDKIAVVIKTIERNGERIEVPYYEYTQDKTERRSELIESKYKIDINQVVPMLKDRRKIDDITKPIEIDGVGGKEIIGYEQKPESIIIERSDQIIKAKTELEK